MAQRILVIDDDLFIREIYEEILKHNGYQVDSAIDGEEGLKKLQTGGYDLILLDVMLPKLDGLQILNDLYNNPAKMKNGPIVLLTNSSADAVINEALKKGATTFFVKANLAPDELLMNIKKLLDNSQST